MAKQTINVGTTANDKKGDSLRAAFTKVNANFTELYTALGLNSDGTLNLGAFEFTGSTMSTTDSTPIVIDQSVTVSSDLTVGGDIVPSTANGGNLGSLAKPFKSLYVSTSTVFLGGVPLSLEPGTNTLKVNNVPISQNITYTDIPNSPKDVADLTDTQGLLGGNANTGDITFTDATISAGTNDEVIVQAQDADGFATARLNLEPEYSTAKLSAFSGENVNTFTIMNADFATGVWQDNGFGIGVVSFTDAQNIGDFFQNTLRLLSQNNVTISINGGEEFAWNGGYNGGGTSTPGYSGTPTVPESPVAVTSITFTYRRESYISVNYDNQEIRLNAQNAGITMDATNSIRMFGDSDIELQAATTFRIAAEENIDIGTGSSYAINVNAGDFRVSAYDDIFITANDAFDIRNDSASDPIRIITDNDDDEYTWSFNADGTLTFPDATVQTTAYTGQGGSIAVGTGTGPSIENVTEILINGTVTEIEPGLVGISISGGQSIDNGDNSLAIDGSGNAIFQGDSAGNGVNRGLEWDYGAEQNNGTNSTVRQDNSGLSVKAWTEGDGGGANANSENGYSASVNIRTNQGDNEKWWIFDGAGNLTLPTGGDILDENGDSVLGLTNDKEVKVTVGNTEYFAIVNRTNGPGDGVEATAVAYDEDGAMITLHVSEITIEQNEVDRLIISKFSDTGALVWQKQIQQDVDVDTVHDLCIIDTDIFVAASFDNGSNIDNIVLMKFNSDGGGVWSKSYQVNLPSEIIENIDLNSNTINTGTYNGQTYDTITIQLEYGDYTWTLQEGTDGIWTTLATAVGAVYVQETNITILYIPQELGITLDYPTKGYRLVRDGVNTFQEVAAVATDGDDIYIAADYRLNRDQLDNNQGLLFKVSGTDGALIWASEIVTGPAANLIYGMDVGPDGNPVVISEIDSGEGPSAAFLSKFDGDDGTVLWGTVVVSNEETEEVSYAGGDVVVDSQNNIFVTVNSSEEINYDGYTSNRTITYVVKFTNQGILVWARRVGPGPCSSVATGIDCDDSGNVYLSALTVAQTNPIRDDGNNNDIKDVLVTAKYSTDGEVLWQRYLESDNYQFGASKDEGVNEGSNPFGGFSLGKNRGRNLSLGLNGKLAIQVTARILDPDDNFNGNNYLESITFQIDQDGREMTVGSGSNKFTVKASRLPGKFITLPTVTGEMAAPTVNDITEDITVATPTVTLAEGELAQQIAQSAPYEYVFGNDGTLTIPNDGDIKLTQTQLGWFSIFGRANNNNDDIWFRANCVDPSDGSVYAVGQDDDSNQGIVVRYNSQGEILWSIKLYDNTNQSGTRCNAAKIHPVTGNVVVLCEYYENPNGALIVEIDPDRAAVIRTLGFRDEGEDDGVNAYDFDFRNNGTVAVVGRKYDEWRSQGVTAQTGSTTGTLFVLSSEVTEGPLPIDANWYVNGTGFASRGTIQYVNRYTGLTGTVREGSGATFDVVINETGIYSQVNIVNGGNNYLVGHKILIPGTSLEGISPTNDIVITVTNVSGTTITGIDFIAGSYGNARAAPYTYSAVSGTNYQTGSGATFDVSVDQNSGAITITNIPVAGSNYVLGDRITVLGTVFPGGTVPTNNLIVVIDAVNGSGGVTGYDSGASSGLAPTTYIKIETTDPVDFSTVGGNWSLEFNLGGECFVYVAEEDGDTLWNKVLSAGATDENERYFSVAFDSNGNVYAAGEMRARDNAAGADLNSYWCAVVSKFDSSGNHEWTRALNNNINDCYAKCVAVRNNTVVVSHYNQNNGETVITKLDNTGTIKWQRTTQSNDDSSVAIDTNGDIYAVIETFFENKYSDCIKVIKFATNGEIAWRKFFGTLVYDFNGTNEYFKNGRNLTLDTDHLYISGYTTAYNNNFENSFLVKLPKSGDCDGAYGAWVVQNDIYDVNKVNSTEATAFTPVVSTGNFESWIPDFGTEWYDPSSNDEYHTFEQILDRDGGAIEFADGTRQTSSAQIIPQREIFNGADHRLQLEDSGRHIFVTNSDTSVVVPYHADTPLPLGFTVVIINESGGTINVDADGGGINIRQAGGSTATYWDLASYGMATLIKVREDLWYISGNVTID